MTFMQNPRKTTKPKKESIRPVIQSDALGGSSEPTTQRKSITNISRTRARRKAIVRRNRIVASVAVVLLALIFVIAVRNIASRKKQGKLPEIQTAETEAAEAPDLKIVYFVVDGDDGNPLYVDMQEMTASWAAEAGIEKRYDLTDEERYEVACTVMAEAEGECFAGKMAIAQCILQAAEDDGISPVEVLTKYEYSQRRPEPSDECLMAVSAVFDFGWAASSDPIKYFYNPALVESNFHESQVYITTIGNHRFFAEKGGESRGIHNRKDTSKADTD